MTRNAGLSQASLEALLRTAGIASPAEYHEVIGSTSSRALALAQDGAPEWTIVAAGHQNAGRGRLGRPWLDDAGRSLLFSVVLRPALSPADLGLLSLLAGASMALACREAAAAEAGCKWPNDLLVRGRKVGGILGEARIDADRVEHVVLGAGVNLEAPPRGLPQAVGLERADPRSLLETFLRAFREHYRPAGDGFAREVVDVYRRLCLTIGRTVRARTIDGRSVDGRATDLDDHGSLVVRTSSGLERVGFGEVEHLEV